VWARHTRQCAGIKLAATKITQLTSEQTTKAIIMVKTEESSEVGPNDKTSFNTLKTNVNLN